MMLIECYHPVISKRKEPIVVPIGNEKYEFKADAKGRRVANVDKESHIESFLAVGHLYRNADDNAAAGLDRKALMAALKAKNVKFAVNETNEALRAKLIAA